MAKSAAGLFYAGDGEVYIAPVATAMPADESAALNAAFKGLGYTTEDAVTITPSQDVSEIRAWQNRYPIGRRVSSTGLDITFTNMEINHRTFVFAFQGGSWALNTAAKWKYTPPAASAEPYYQAMIVDWLDGANKTRWTIPKVIVSDLGDLNPRPDEPAQPSLTVSLVTTGTGDPFNVLTNDARFDPLT